jgi:hypothetical protein
MTATPANIESNYYAQIHARLRRERGRTTVCVFGCLNQARYEWAHRPGDIGEVDEFFPACVQCHTKFDHAIAAVLKDTAAKDGHWGSGQRFRARTEPRVRNTDSISSKIWRAL